MSASSKAWDDNAGEDISLQMAEDYARSHSNQSALTYLPRYNSPAFYALRFEGPGMRLTCARITRGTRHRLNQVHWVNDPDWEIWKLLTEAPPRPFDPLASLGEEQCMIEELEREHSRRA